MTQLEKLRSAMSEAAISALLVTDLINVAWLTGFVGSFGRVLITATDCVFMTDGRYAIQAEEQVTGASIQILLPKMDGDQFLIDQVSALGISKLSFEATHLTYSFVQTLTPKLLPIEFEAAPDLFASLRMVKTPAEIDLIRDACALTDVAFDHIRRMIMPGVTEYGLQLDLEFFIRRHGATMAFDPIIVSGENSARPHGKATEKAFENGDFLTMDFGARVKHYNADLTRTVVVGKASEEHKRIYHAVLESQLAAIAAIKPGGLASDCDKISRDVLRKHDLEQHFTHGLGHGLGRLVHDSGRLNSSSKDVFAVGQVWTIEPGVYIPGFGGCRIEDDVVVTEHGVEVLNRAPKELLELPVS